MFRITTKTIAKEFGETTADAEVLALVRVIEDKISEARALKQNSLETPLPREFDGLKHLNKQDSQTLVYGRLLEELDKAGFKSEINLFPTITMLKVTWPAIINGQLAKEMKQIVMNHLPKPKVQEEKQTDRPRRKKTKDIESFV